MIETASEVTSHGGITPWDFIIFVFPAAVGVLQLVAVRTQLKGLLFLKKPALTYLFSFLVIGISYYWFFQRDNRMDPGMAMRQTNLEGGGMFFYFCLASFLAVIFTLVVSSLIHSFRHEPHTNDNIPNQGLDTLRGNSYFEAIKNSFKSKER